MLAKDYYVPIKFFIHLFPLAHGSISEACNTSPGCLVWFLEREGKPGCVLILIIGLHVSTSRSAAGGHTDIQTECTVPCLVPPLGLHISRDYIVSGCSQETVLSIFFFYRTSGCVTRTPFRPCPELDSLFPRPDEFRKITSK
jgi:hypothetical protein